MFTRICAALILLALTSPAFAKPAVPAPVFRDMVAYAAGPSMGIAYFTVESQKYDVVDGLASDCCEAVELHSNVSDHGIMRMRKAGGVVMPARRALAVQPPERGGDSQSGLHVMLIGLKKPLVAGEKIGITVNFRNAPSQLVFFPVEDKRSAAPAASPAANGPAAAEHSHH